MSKTRARYEQARVRYERVDGVRVAVHRLTLRERFWAWAERWFS